jgi:GNAT superfamily N-acetyltransferase
MNTTVREVLNKKDLMKFIKMPWNIYKNDPCWVPPLIFEQKEFLNPKKGPFFEYGEAKLFIAERDGKAVGRISAHINHRHEEVFKDNKGFFGFFECEDNLDTAGKLFEAAAAYLKSKGKVRMEGPFSFSIYDEIGVLVSGFDSIPYLMNVHNPPYYQKLFEENGFQKVVDWYAFRGKKGITDVKIDERYYKLKERLLKNSAIKIRNVRKGKGLTEDAKEVRKVFNQAWSRNWGHVNLTDREWERIKSALLQLVIYPLTYIVEVNGNVAGFALSVYDANLIVKEMNGNLFPFNFLKLLNVNKVKRFRLILMGVLEEYRTMGLEVLMYISIIERAKELGFEEVEMSNIVETNLPMLQSLKHLAVERYKTYRIYGKDI